MSEQELLLDQARMLIARLERISVDSVWSHRSSGQRGALLKIVEKAELPPAGANGALSRHEWDSLERLIRSGYEMLEKAAQEQFP